MNINYGLLPPLDAPRRDAEGRRLNPAERGRARKRAMSARALADLDGWLAEDLRNVAA
jgi:methylenetetrahydrofolate--tRNA-(uracil-5-)-methyltransferase